MTEFTPIASTLGGVLIGLSAAMLMLFHGRIAGISGIFGGVLRRPSGDTRWRLAFVLGLVVGGLVLGFAAPQWFVVEVERSPLAIIIAGLAVGFGTRLGSGCTSGHGVCGISRFSRRSILATVTFMAVGAATAFVITQFFGGVL